jgi:polyisoprenoid-binding protein YceI
MKITFKLLVFLLVTSAVAVSCGSGSEASDVNQAQEVSELVGGTFNVDAATSSITWNGERFDGSAHNGTIGVSEGTLAVADGAITGGSFTIDMNTIAVTDDMPEAKKSYLIGHLTGTSGDSKKDADFFQVTKYPTSKFEITKVEAIAGTEGATHTISGNLTMLDSTHNVTFTTTVAIENGKLTATTDNFTFDRTLWGIMYDSTLIGMVKEKALKNEITISVKLTANAEATAGETAE